MATKYGIFTVRKRLRSYSAINLKNCIFSNRFNYYPIIHYLFQTSCFIKTFFSYRVFLDLWSMPVPIDHILASGHQISECTHRAL